MKKLSLRLLTALIAMALVIGCVPAVWIRAEAAATPQSWNDDFGSNKGGNYTPYGYWWNMNGVLTVGDPNAAAGVSYYWLNDYIWDDFVMEFDVINQTNQFGVIFRASNPTGSDCQSQGYGVLSDCSWAFFVAENGSFSTFDTIVDGSRWANPVDGCAWASQPGTQNVHWKIVAKGERIEVYFNNAQTPSMAMDASLYSSGYIGFRTWNNGGETTAVIDNLVITEITDEPEPDPEPTPEPNPEPTPEPDPEPTPTPTPNPTPTEPENNKQAQTWEDDFSSGKGEYYIPHGYWWNMDGQLTVGDSNAGAGVCYYWLKDLVWDDFVMEFDVLSQSAEFGVIIRAQDTSPNDSKNQGYGILYDTDWAFFMAENGSFTTFNDTWAESVEGYPYACQPGSTQNVHWKIVAEGDTISVYFNHAQTPSMVMKSELWESGYIGFRTNNPGGAVTAVVDNLTIRELGTPETGDEMNMASVAIMGIAAVALATLLLNKRCFL